MRTYPARAYPRLPRMVLACLRFYSFIVCVFIVAFLLCIFLPNAGLGDKTWNQQEDWTQKVANLFRERGLAEEWPLILGAVAKKSGVYPTPSPEPAPQDPGANPDFFAKTSDFAISPKTGRRALSIASGADGNTNAWKWTYDQVRTGLSDPRWLHRDSADAVGATLARLFRRIGDYR